MWWSSIGLSLPIMWEKINSYDSKELEVLKSIPAPDKNAIIDIVLIAKALRSKNKQTALLLLQKSLLHATPYTQQWALYLLLTNTFSSLQQALTPKGLNICRKIFPVQYLKKYKLFNKKKLAKHLKKLLKKYLVTDDIKCKEFSTKISNANANANAIKKYYQAQQYKCLGDFYQANLLFTQVAPQLAVSSKTLLLSIFAYDQLARLQRYAGQRIAAASTYRTVSNMQDRYYSKINIMSSHHNVTLDRFLNNYLWSARYQALVGKYNIAQRHLKIVHKIIATLLKQRIKPSWQNTLKIYQVEAAYIEAFRLYLPQKKYNRALIIIKNITPILAHTKKWKHRFQWLEGMLYYLLAKYNSALQLWQANHVKSPRLLYWSAQAHIKLGNLIQAKKIFRQIKVIAPLSYYNLSANPKSIKDILPDRGVSERNHPSSKVSIKKINFLFKRVQILVRYNLMTWGQLAGKELVAAVLSNLSVLGDTQDLSGIFQLLSTVDLYEQVINISYRQRNYLLKGSSQWSKYLKFEYPVAKKNIFLQHKSSALLYAITKQESRFNITAHSHANALGLMQITIPTAYRLLSPSYKAKKLQFYDLQQPQLNITLGSNYIEILQKRYKNKMHHVIAAYNAGENALDLWLQYWPKFAKNVWIELIPFVETRNYVKKVLRNFVVYQHILSTYPAIASRE